MQGEVGVDHAYEGHLGEVMALGDHLRADEDLGSRRGELRQHGLKACVGRGDVGVEAQKLDAGQQRRDLALQTLGAHAVAPHVHAAAGITRRRRGLAVAADAATHALAAADLRERDVAVRAVPATAAVPAHERGRVAAPVEEQDGLLARLDRTHEGLSQRR